MTREQRLVFGEVAEQYQRARPTYPESLYDTIVDLAELRPGDRVLEIGAGTGKATEGFVARRFDVTAIEPSPQMAAVLRGRFAAVTVIESNFEETTVEPHAFAIVAAAQSWHWVDVEVGVPKAADALRPGGWLTLFWNRPDLDGCAWHDELQPIYEEHAPHLAHKNRRATQENTAREYNAHLFASPRFGEPVVLHIPWTASYSTAEYIHLLATQSDHVLLPAGQRSRLHDAIADSIERHGGAVSHPYLVDVIAAPVR